MADEYSDITWAIDDIRSRAGSIGLYRDYYNGEHSTPWATEKWNHRFRSLFEMFRDNLCPRIVNTQADKVQLTGIQGPQPEPDPDATAPPAASPLDTAIAAVWTREKLEQRQGEITKSALKDGDCFVIIWPDSTGTLARWFVQRADRMAVLYKDEPQGEIECAAKIWPVEKEGPPHRDTWTWRLNLYYSDRIERYVTEKRHGEANIPRNPANWLQYEPELTEEARGDDEGDETQEDIPGYIITNPYGMVPVFVFPNDADTGSYGTSVLKDIIPLQDALNKSVANMLIAEEFVAWPQRVLLGVEVETDEEGNPTGKEQRQALDRILAIGNPNAKAAEWSAADLSNFIKAQDSYRAEMARVSGAPLHYLLLEGEFPSGEAMDAAEAPLVSLSDDRVLVWKPIWERAMSFSLQIEKVDHDPAALNAIFKPTKRQSSVQMAEEWRVKKEMGVPEDQIWREMGYDEAQIKEFAEQKAARTEAMQAAFDAGAPDATSPEGGAPVE